MGPALLRRRVASASEIPAAERTTQRTIAVTTWLCVAVVLASAALVLTFGHGRDQSIYALVAREMLDGKMPYRDAFDFKPPGIFVVYALTRALFGSAQWGIRVVEVAAMLATAWGLVRLSEITLGRRSVGYIAAALASQVHAQLDFWHTAQPETFGATLTVWGLILSVRAASETTPRRALGRWIGAGVLFGAAGLMKPPLAGVGALVAVVATVHGVLAQRPIDWRLGGRSSLPVGGMFAGGVLPMLLVVIGFGARGALGDLYQVLFVFTPQYTKISWENASLSSMAYYGLVEWLTTYSSALLTGLICLVVMRPSKEELPKALLLLGCIFVHIAGIVMQGKFFPYHWGATFPLTALLAALGLEKVLVLSSRRTWGPPLFAASFALLAAAKCPVPSFGEVFYQRSKYRLQLLLHPPEDAVAAWDGLASIADVDAGENRAVARYLAEHTQPTDPVFVWGFECAIYDLAERPLASRFIYNVPQRAVWSAAPMQQALMIDLRRTRPVAIVVEHHDVFPMVTGSSDDSARSLQRFGALQQLLDDDLVYGERIGDFDVYLREPPDADAQ